MGGFVSKKIDMDSWGRCKTQCKNVFALYSTELLDWIVFPFQGRKEGRKETDARLRLMEINGHVLKTSFFLNKTCFRPVS
jgi:hypothetical protein